MCLLSVAENVKLGRMVAHHWPQSFTSLFWHQELYLVKKIFQQFPEVSLVRGKLADQKLRVAVIAFTLDLV